MPLYNISSGIAYLYSMNACISADTDECLLNKDNRFCSQMCINTNGSYYCLCNDGFLLQSDNYNCIGIYTYIHFMYSCFSLYIYYTYVSCTHNIG